MIDFYDNGLLRGKKDVEDSLKHLFLTNDLKYLKPVTLCKEGNEIDQIILASVQNEKCVKHSYFKTLVGKIKAKPSSETVTKLVEVSLEKVD